jgi:hypothetical protein
MSDAVVSLIRSLRRGNPLPIGRFVQTEAAGAVEDGII